MSRSALWRQEGNVKERERQADELFRLAVEEGRNNRARNLFPTWGPDDSFHLNPMLLQNTIKSSYFQKCCRDILDYNTLVDQIYYDVKHVEPWAQGSNREPSVAFCLLLRLFTLRCTEKQMKLLLDHPDSPYIRAIGFLYLRFVGDPKIVFDWIQPYLYDDEPIQVCASASKPNSNQTIGKFVRALFSDKNYHGTILPRLPIQIERDIQVKMLQAEKIEERAKKHHSSRSTMDHFKVGSRVMALYEDEENPIQWYEAVIDRVITTDPDTSQPLRHPKFVVTFPEYMNTETVSLGEMEMIGATDSRDYPGAMPGGGVDSARRWEPREDNRGYGQDRSGGRQPSSRRSDDGNSRGYGDSGRGYEVDRERPNRGYQREQPRGYDRGGSHRPNIPRDDDLYEEVRRRERENVTSSGRNAVARRPPGTKASFSTTETRDYGRREGSPARGPPPPRPPKEASVDERAAPEEPKKRSAEEVAAIQEKKRKLMAKYG